MSKTLSILAAATLLVANAATAPVAEAGGGVRLGFGFPLGSFVARPSGRYAAPSYSHSNSHRSNGYAQAEARRQARAASIAEAKREAAADAKRAAVAEARREAAAEAKRDAGADARREKLAAERAEARRIARLNEQREEKVEKVEKVAAIEKPAVVEAVSLAPEAAPVPVRPETALAQADVSVGQPKSLLSDVEAKDAGDKPAATATAAAPVVAKAKLVAAEAPARSIDCKKFIPSAGLTISVPCAN